MEYNDKQFAAALQMQDLSSDEKMLAMQQAQADQLRKQGMQPSARRDFGSQATRALQGVGAGLADQQNAQAMKDFSRQKQYTLGQVRATLGNEGAGYEMGPPAPGQKPLTTPPYTDGGTYGDTY